MSSRPKVISPTTTNNVSTPPLRAKASLSSVAKIRRAPSPRPSPPTASSVVNGPARVANASRRPLSSQERPLATLSPVTRDDLPYHSSPVTPTFPRQRTASQSTAFASPTTPGTLKVKAKVSSLAKPQPTQSTSGTPPIRPGLHSRSNSIVGLRAQASIPPPVPPLPSLPPKPRPKSPPASPNRPLPPIVNTFPPTPTKSLDAVPNSPRTSDISSQSSVSVKSGYGSITHSVARVLPLSQSPEDDEEPISRSGTTPVPLYTPIKQPSAFLSSPPFLSPQDDADGASGGLTSPTHERKGSMLTEEEVEQRAEARTNRKIADLEIQTTSLQQLTASLERERHKQSLEIRDLRRKLRESRLALPPRTFQSLKATWEADGLDLEDEDEDEDETEDGNEDPGWARVKGLVHDILSLGKRAVDEGQEFIEKRTKTGGGVVRVLTAGEVEELEGNTDGANSDEDGQGDSEADKESPVEESETPATVRPALGTEDDHHETPG